MSNSSTWDAPDTVQTKQGQTTPGVMYIVDPATGKVISPATAGSGDAVTIADGADATLGAMADTSASTDTGTFSLMALFKRLLGKFTIPASLADGTANPTLGAFQVFPMVYDGTNWQRGPRAVNGLGDTNTLGGAIATGIWIYNGTTWDRARSDQIGQLKASLYGKNAAAGDTAISVDSSGRVAVSLGTLIAGEDQTNNVMRVEEWGNATNITTKTTTTVKSGAGFLEGITINKIGTTDTLTIYDNTAASGTVIGTITVQATTPYYPYKARFSTGLTVVSGGGTAGDYTVVSR